MGIYEHGLGNWDAIKDSDPNGLGKKILPESRSLKPQASHLQTRAEYLLKLLQAEAKRKTAKRTKTSPRKAATSLSRGNRGRQLAASVDASKNLSKASSRQTELLVNINRDLVALSDAESNASSTRSRRGRKRTQLPSKQPPPKRLKSSPRKKTEASRAVNKLDRTLTPGPRTSPHKGSREEGGKSQGTPREELSGFEGISDDQRLSDIGEGVAELDEDTFEKVDYFNV